MREKTEKPPKSDKKLKIDEDEEYIQQKKTKKNLAAHKPEYNNEINETIESGYKEEIETDTKRYDEIIKETRSMPLNKQNIDSIIENEKTKKKKYRTKKNLHRGVY